MPDVTLEIVETTPIVLELSGSNMSTSSFNTFMVEWLGDLGVYDSDESAAAGDVAIDGWYITAANHVEAPGGLLRKRLT